MTPGDRLGSPQAQAVLSDNGASGRLDYTSDPAARLSSNSRFAQRLRRRYTAELALLPGAADH